jgi:hypothetical protein
MQGSVGSHARRGLLVASGISVAVVIAVALAFSAPAAWASSRCTIDPQQGFSTQVPEGQPVTVAWSWGNCGRDAGRLVSSQDGLLLRINTFGPTGGSFTFCSNRELHPVPVWTHDGVTAYGIAVVILFKYGAQIVRQFPITWAGPNTQHCPGPWDFGQEARSLGL